MKKLLLLFTFIGFASGIFAQGSKTINLATAGTLSTLLASTELTTITNLTLIGTIDARDFKTMRDEMPLLIVLDLSGVTIAAYNGVGGTSPISVDFPADAIPDYAFYNSNTWEVKKSLSTVTIPSSVTSIGEGAFWDCRGLTLINIPPSATSIGLGAFQGCIGLTNVTISSSVTSIGDFAFWGCSGLTTVTIPSSVISIGEGAFHDCSGLTTVAIPSSVTSIGDKTFWGCSGLTTVTIPNSVTSIGGGAFFDCIGLTTVTIPLSVTSIGYGAFFECSGLTTVAIPNSVTSIGDWAFSDCVGLTTVTIPSSVTSIGDYAFKGCSVLTSITTSRITPLDLSSSTNIFYKVNTTTCTLNVPLGSKSAYQVAPEWKDFTNIVEKNLTGIAPIISDQQLIVYPNPTSGKVKVAFDRIPQGGTTLTVNDFTGKTILTQFIQNKEEWINLGGNSPGVYLIRTNMKDFKVQKVILK